MTLEVCCRKTLIGVALGLLLVLQAGVVAGKSGPAVSRDTKLLAWGVNALSTNNLKDHIAALQEDYPALDGVITVFWPDNWNDRHWGGNCGLFGNRKFTRDDFSRTISDLRSTHFGRIRNNFLNVATSVTTSEDVQPIEWFDDRWPVIAANMGIYAAIAREVGFKGILLDFEEYYTQKHLLWKYFSYKAMDQYRRGKGLPEVKRADYEAQVRKCGRLMMREVTSAYPGITMLMIPDTGWKGHRDYDLLPAFVDGILEGAGPRVTLVDGCEDGYSAQTYGEFLSIRQDAAKAGPAISNLASVYRKRMRYGFGLWLDYSPDKYGGWHTAVGDLDKNYRSPDRMEHAVYNALSAADKGSYVWLYVWHPDYWWQPSSRGKPSPIHPHQCVLCPHSGMPKEYLGALAKVRAPHDLSWTSPVSLMGKQYRAEQLAVMGPNLLGNSGFEAWSAGAGSPPDGWTGGATERIGEATGAHSGSFAVQLSKRDESHMFIEQRIPGGQYASKTVILGVWCKLTADSAGSLSILSKVGDKYVVEGNDAECPADGQWHFIVARQTIPAGAETVYLRLNAYSLEAYAPVDFDDAVAVVEK